MMSRSVISCFDAGDRFGLVLCKSCRSQATETHQQIIMKLLSLARYEFCAQTFTDSPKQLQIYTTIKTVRLSVTEVVGDGGRGWLGWSTEKQT